MDQCCGIRISRELEHLIQCQTPEERDTLGVVLVEALERELQHQHDKSVEVGVLFTHFAQHDGELPAIAAAIQDLEEDLDERLLVHTVVAHEVHIHQTRQNVGQEAGVHLDLRIREVDLQLAEHLTIGRAQEGLIVV